MKTLFYTLIAASLLSTPVAQAEPASTTFIIDYEDHGSVTYEGCWKCIGYYSEFGDSASIVLYEQNAHSYWTLNVDRGANGELDVSFYFTDRNPDVPEKFHGTYYPEYEVNDYIDFKELNLKPGGRIVGKIQPIKAKGFGNNKIATFVGSFDITLQ